LTTWPFEPFVREIVGLLVRGEYSKLETLSGGVRLSAADVARAVQDYGVQLALPPKEREPALEVVPVLNSEPPRWSVHVPLWSVQEGPSDLTLELSILERSEGHYQVEIDDLHVL
jgi:hypothetical protein